LVKAKSKGDEWFWLRCIDPRLPEILMETEKKGPQRISERPSA
jgi:hypothetical protein